MKKIMVIIGGIVLFVMSFVIIKQFKKTQHAHGYTIGILQTASHPALDAARDGFIETLKNKMGNDVTFVVQNAQGSVANAHAIAQQFHANKQYNGFFAIATTAAQAMSAIEQQKPIIIAAVTDPQALGLVHATTNVCGIRDMIDVDAEVDMLTQLVPDAKTVGLLYTSGETNSLALVKLMRTALIERGLTPVDFAISNESDMQAMLELACRKVDVILAPTDNTVAATITLIVAITTKYKKPLIVSDNMLVKHGALAARGVDYKASGAQAAQIAYDVLVHGKKPYELPIKQAESKNIVINETTLATLGLTVPAALQKNSTFVS